MYLIHIPRGDLLSIWKGFEQVQKDGLTTYLNPSRRISAVSNASTFTGASVSATSLLVTSESS